MRILIVEDDRDLAAALDDALRFEGYATRVAYNGLEAVRMLAEQSIDIVLLDRDLPIMSGDAVMETIASNDIPVSVLMLTAAAQVRDRINGLELGADDYLIKPFAYPELLARIRALQRRAGKGDFSGTEFSHNGIVLDTVRHTVTRDGKPVNLSPKEYGVLLEIMKADGSYVNAEELFDTVWAGASATDLTDAIKTTVYSLRRKLGEGNGITPPEERGTVCHDRITRSRRRNRLRRNLGGGPGHRHGRGNGRRQRHRRRQWPYTPSPPIPLAVDVPRPAHRHHIHRRPGDAGHRHHHAEHHRLTGGTAAEKQHRHVHRQGHRRTDHGVLRQEPDQLRPRSGG